MIINCYNSNMKQKPAQPVQGLIDGLEVLQALAMSPGKVSGKELAGELGLEVTRTNRLLGTLAHLGLAHRTRDRKYIAGSGMHVLAAHAIFGSGIMGISIDHLQELEKEGLLVAMGVLWKDRVTYLYHHTPDAPAINAVGRMTLFPAAKSSIGLSLLARLEKKEVRNIYRGREVEGYKNVTELLKALEKVKTDGFAEVRQDYHSIAVPVGEPAFAAIAFSGNITKKQIPGLVEKLKVTAGKIIIDLNSIKKDGN